MLASFKYVTWSSSARWIAGSMYHVPSGVSTCAWKPRGVRSSAIVADVSVMPRPLNVLISGNFDARPGASTSFGQTANDWFEPSGAGRAMTIGFASEAALSVAASASARLSTVDRDRTGRAVRVTSSEN